MSEEAFEQALENFFWIVWKIIEILLRLLF